MLNDAYRGRRVLVTGDTGFKGSWLCHWLTRLGADVHGLGLPPATTPDLFSTLHLADAIDHTALDIRNGTELIAHVRKLEPEIIFHLAAQPLVRESYADPKTTFDTNVGGVVNLLEAVRVTPAVQACVVVTTDKCYENREWVWGYRENDPLGGHDPYSASKGAAELVVASYRRSFYQDGSQRLATARAGNVIGGGDWAADRIVTDFVANIMADRPLTLRYPAATRPWQHVCEPLAGYLLLAARMLEPHGERFAEAWNFGPHPTSVTTVRELAELLVHSWGRGTVVASQEQQPHEANLLQLDCSKAHTRLAWRPVWDVAATVQQTVSWYRAFHRQAEMRAITDRQLGQYQADAEAAGLAWAANHREPPGATHQPAA